MAMTLSPASISRGYPWHGFLVIEQQSNWTGDLHPEFYGAMPGDPPVINPTGFTGYPTPMHLWDTDDLFMQQGTGPMKAGETFAIEVPIIVDNRRRLIQATGKTASKAKRAIMRVSIPEMGWLKEYEFSGLKKVCIWIPRIEYSIDQATHKIVMYDPRVGIIPDSNGGQGVFGNLRWEMTAINRMSSAGITGSVLYPNQQVIHDYCGDVVETF